MACRGPGLEERDEHFIADGTLIEAWPSLKSFVRQDGADAKKVQSARTQTPALRMRLWCITTSQSVRLSHVHTPYTPTPLV